MIVLPASSQKRGLWSSLGKMFLVVPPERRQLSDYSSKIFIYDLRKKMCLERIWVIPKIGVPQNGWFITENPMKMDDLGIPVFLETPISKVLQHWDTEIAWDHGRRSGLCELDLTPCESLTFFSPWISPRSFLASISDNLCVKSFTSRFVYCASETFGGFILWPPEYPAWFAEFPPWWTSETPRNWFIKDFERSTNG